LFDDRTLCNGKIRQKWSGKFQKIMDRCKISKNNNEKVAKLIKSSENSRRTIQSFQLNVIIHKMNGEKKSNELINIINDLGMVIKENNELTLFQLSEINEDIEQIKQGKSNTLLEN
jgi:hypothetical protein